MFKDHWKEKDSSFLRTLEEELRNEFERILVQEELYWFQKSKFDWINQGDRNTRFYHAQTLSRRRRNCIEGIKYDIRNGLRTQILLGACDEFFH